MSGKFLFARFSFLLSVLFGNFSSMATWSTGNNYLRQQQLVNNNPKVDAIKEQFQKVTEYNYSLYCQQLQKAEEASHNPLGLGVSVGSSNLSKIDSLPPGRPQNENKKLRFSKSELSYGDYRRLKELENPTGSSSINYFSVPTQSCQRNTYDPRDNRRAKQDDGWGDDAPASDAKKSFSKSRNASSSDRGHKSKNNVKQASDDWDDLPPPPPPLEKKSGASKDDDIWDDLIESSAAKKVSSTNPPKAAQTDDWDDEPSVQQNIPINQGNDDDWGDLLPASSTSQSKVKVEKSDWSDDEAKSTSFSNGNQRARSDSRSRENSFRRGASRDGSTDRFRSGSRASNGNERSRPGEWDCSKCHKNNFAHRTDCFRCHEPKGEATGSTQNRPGGGFQRQPRADDWQCLSCNEKANFGNRYECFKCKAPRADDGGANNRSKSFQRPPREPHPDDWQCPSCRGTNFNGRTECFRCKEPKADCAGSSYQSRSSSYRGNSRGRNYDRTSSYNSAPVKSGWSDDESDDKKDKKPANGNDDWDIPSQPTKKRLSNDDDDWLTCTAPAPKKLKAADDDDDSWDVKDEPKVKPEVDGCTASTSTQNDANSAIVATSNTQNTADDDDDWGPPVKPVIAQAQSSTSANQDDDDW